MNVKVRPAKGAFLPVILILAAVSVAGLSVMVWLSSKDEAPASGALVIYSSTDEDQFASVLAEFRRRNPAVRVIYKSLPAREVYDRTRQEIDRSEAGADLVISSSMDLQIKLVNDRYAQPYSSPHRAQLPNWAVWKNEAFAVTSEPIVIGYNKRAFASAGLPAGHDDLAALLHAQPSRFRDRIGLYDPGLSPTGYMYIRQDLHVDRDNWDLIGGIGRAGPRLFTSTKEMIERVSSGDLLLAYNIIGSYALQRAKADPDFGVIVPNDYVLVGSRVALITRLAPNPAAAQRFLDFILSSEGQRLLSLNNMIPLRSDVPPMENWPASVNQRAIHVGPALMADLDQVNRDRFFLKWKSSMARASGGPVPPKTMGGGTNETVSFNASVS